nr:Tn3 family transposase [Streptomyces sp. 135]
MLEHLHRMLRSKQVFAKNSSKWGDPRAKLLAGQAWQQARPTVLASLNLPEEAGGHLQARAALLDGTYREVAARVPDNAQIVFDDDGRLHFAALEPEPEPASLLDLRAAVNAMLPRVDLPEVLLEVFSWTGADQAFASVTGGEARLKDLHVTIAALLVAHGCNVGYTPVMGGADPLKYGRLSHVDQTYLRLATYRAANAALIEHQVSIGLAQSWGGGLVASVDGMRFVVPVPSVYARPNPKYFGRRGGATWLNMINDQAAGLGGKVVAGTPRDSLYVLDVLDDRDGGRRPEMIVTDTASYLVTWTPFPSLRVGGGRHGRQVRWPWGRPCAYGGGVRRTARPWSSCSTRTRTRSRSLRGSCGSSRPGTARRTRWSRTPTTYVISGGSSRAGV